jgi:FkbM family methyltransferase
MPLITIVIPVFDRPQEVVSLLQSIDRYCTQKDQFTVIVVDDGSHCCISEFISRFSFELSYTCIKQANSGPASARNHGARAAFSEWILFLDSDVIVTHDIIKYIIDYLGLTEAIGLVGVELNIIATPYDDALLNVINEAPSSGADGGSYHTAGILYSRRKLIGIGGFDESFNRAACEDVELACRMLKQGKIVFHQQIKILHPPRLKTVRSVWKKRNHWIYVRNLGVRHSILAWPHKTTKYPRARIAASALLFTPFAHLRRYSCAVIRIKSRHKFSSAYIFAIFAVETISSWLMVLPIIFFPVFNSILMTESKREKISLSESISANFLFNLKCLIRYFLKVLGHLIPFSCVPILGGPLRYTKLPIKVLQQTPRILYEDYDRNFIDLILKYTSESTVFYDIGAHHGFWSLRLQKELAPNIMIYAFEAAPAEAHLLKNLICSYHVGKYVSVIEMAVSDIDGCLDFAVGTSSYTGMLTQSKQFKQLESTLYQVRSVALDSFVEQQGILPPSLIKIDVEGAEGLVLKGAINTLIQYRPVLFIELHGPEAVKEVLNILDSFDYVVNLVDKSGFLVQAELESILGSFKKGHWTAHILCLPLSR